MVKKFIREVRDLYQRPQGTIHLIETAIYGNEYQYINDCLNSGKVSTIGEEVAAFEEAVARRIGAKYAIATSSGTAALHLGLMSIGVRASDWVITQPFTFIATANAILHARAKPLFVDIDRETLGLSPEALGGFLASEAEVRDDGICYHRRSGRRVAACLPVHALGHPARLPEITAICRAYRIPVLEDAAEGLGSTRAAQSVATFGEIGVFSFNGNKIVTSGGGGMLVTDEYTFARRARWISIPSSDLCEAASLEPGYNYRMPALNAALGLAQWQSLDQGIRRKRQLTHFYQEITAEEGVKVMMEPEGTFSNYWLQTIRFADRDARDTFVRETNEAGIRTRAAWPLLHRHRLFGSPHHGALDNSRWAEDHLANVPSTIVPHA